MITEPRDLVFSRYSPQPYGKEGEEKESRLIYVHYYILSGYSISGKKINQKNLKHSSNQSKRHPGLSVVTCYPGKYPYARQSLVHRRN